MGHIRKLVDYSLSVLVALPFCVGLPPLFWELSLKAAQDSGFQGGMFHFPDTTAEILWSSGLCIFSFPFAILSIIFAFPIFFILNWVDVERFAYRVPYLTNLTVGSDFLIASIPALLLHILSWGTLFHGLRMSHRKSSVKSDGLS